MPTAAQRVALPAPRCSTPDGHPSCASCSTLRRQIDDRDHTITQLRMKIQRLERECGDMLNETWPTLDSSLGSSSGSSTLDTVLFGNSLVKYFTPTEECDRVEAVRGACIQDVMDMIQEHPSKSVDNVVVVVGTNECSSDDLNTADIIDNFGELIDRAKQTARKSVVISSIPPRTDSKYAQQKTEEVNVTLGRLCDTRDVKFVDNDDTFFHRNGLVDRKLLAVDQLHLSNYGQQQLMSNLDLGEKMTLAYDKKDHRRVSDLPPKDKKGHVHKDSTEQGHQGTSSQRHCRNCGERGHALQQCKHDGPVECHSCGGRGHKKKFCTTVRQTEDPTTDGGHGRRRHTPGHHKQSNVRCFFCGESGHVKDTCRHGSKVECHTCGAYGHKAKFCDY